MKIGLLDIDSHNFPNLALMKISAYHKGKGDSVEFATMFEEYDILYQSKIFSFSPDNEFSYNTKKIIKGGSGYDLKNKLPDYIEYVIPDYDLYGCQHAYGFLTRGCPNKCEWCVVPQKEGTIKPYMDIEEIISNKKSVILMDNNILACDFGIRQIEKIIKMKIKVDFNQGLDCRLVDNTIAKLLSKIKCINYIRFACDSIRQMKYVENAVKLIRKHSGKKGKFFIYVLVKKDIQDAYKRVMFLKSLEVDPFAQPYRDFLNNFEPNMLQKRFARWVNHKAIFKTVAWEDYK